MKITEIFDDYKTEPEWVINTRNKYNRISEILNNTYWNYLAQEKYDMNCVYNKKTGLPNHYRILNINKYKRQVAYYERVEKKFFNKYMKMENILYHN
jgi:hypothetical protein